LRLVLQAEADGVVQSVFDVVQLGVEAVAVIGGYTSQNLTLNFGLNLKKCILWTNLPLCSSENYVYFGRILSRDQLHSDSLQFYLIFSQYHTHTMAMSVGNIWHYEAHCIIKCIGTDHNCMCYLNFYTRKVNSLNMFQIPDVFLFTWDQTEFSPALNSVITLDSK
jgi:hypothetical protein